MKLLILGGTEFVGRAIAEDALARGWEVTVFHRGKKPSPPGTTTLHGDRTAPDGLAALADGSWDLVVDTWSAAPAVVRESARLLASRTAHYTYISSRSVYTYPTPAQLDETGAVVDSAPGLTGEVPYAEAKRGGELAVVESFGDRALLARAGLIIGPYENIGRLPWWLNRIARGGPVLAPGPRDLPLQYIDARDLAAWTLDAAEAGLSGAYNVISAPGHTTMGGLLDACVAATGSSAELRWTDPEPILEAGIEPWTQLPIWIPQGELHEMIHQGNVSKVLAAGLRCRPVEETVADTWTWLRSRGGEAPQRPDRPTVGLDPEVEAKVLEG
ncbi:NAD-dependent epimerase/dehydratase family protein [Streptomyces beijiangensis]|uniref:Reductase n=1 Tax=Streptomyces beijiangensis TaxID=163361 RepID=A0A939JKW1_9ACTN|nr:NAD-dependent epimerase/dehydratase family protein [Streptomyces beijiangensis]MBO0515104.1 reductase [Streptomyces beijiangensis]